MIRDRDQDGASGVDFRHIVLEGELAAIIVRGECARDLIIQIVPPRFDQEVQSVEHRGVLVFNCPALVVPGNGDRGCIFCDIFKRVIGQYGRQIAVLSPVLPGPDIVSQTVPHSCIELCSAIDESTFQLLSWCCFHSVARMEA